MSNCNSPFFCQARDDFKELLWTTHFVPILQHLRRTCAQLETPSSEELNAVNTPPYTQLKNLHSVLDKAKTRANMDSQPQDADPLKPTALLSPALSSVIQCLLSYPDCEIFLSSDISHLISLLHADLHTIFRLRFEMACLRNILMRKRENLKVCMKAGEAKIQEELQEAARLIVRATDLEMGVEDIGMSPDLGDVQGVNTNPL